MKKLLNIPRIIFIIISILMVILSSLSIGMSISNIIRDNNTLEYLSLFLDLILIIIFSSLNIYLYHKKQ